MIFNKHSELEGQHAFLSASKYHWVNYTDEKLDTSYINWRAAQKGTELHAFAADAIRLGINMPRSKKTLNMYVNDAIGFRMTPEQVLYYSPNCFGTADAISFKHDILRIHDYKSGSVPASFTQLMIYASLFCLEYNVNPENIQTELRIYQNDDVAMLHSEPQDIRDIMETIIRFDKRINDLKGG